MVCVHLTFSIKTSQRAGTYVFTLLTRTNAKLLKGETTPQRSNSGRHACKLSSAPGVTDKFDREHVRNIAWVVRKGKVESAFPESLGTDNQKGRSYIQSHKDPGPAITPGPVSRPFFLLWSVPKDQGFPPRNKPSWQPAVRPKEQNWSEMTAAQNRVSLLLGLGYTGERHSGSPTEHRGHHQSCCRITWPRRGLFPCPNREDACLHWVELHFFFN